MENLSGSAVSRQAQSIGSAAFLAPDIATSPATEQFVARRNSSGGMGAGFKGSCDVLERSVNAIGKDVAAWLQNAVDGAQLGDLR